MKYQTIHRYKSKYAIRTICGFFKVSSSGYYGWLRKTKQPDRDVELAALIGECHSKTKKTYVYRRVKIWLNREKGITVNHKTILRVMNKTNQLSQIRQRRRWIQYHNQKFTRYPNLLNRNFQADKPNQKWATDITYIMTKKDGVLFLSAIKDLYDGSIVAYKMSRTQSQKLVLDTIQAALKKEKVADGLTLHSDQGFQYTSAAYLNLTKRYGITASMSRAGNPLDNASMECFFGVLKTECLYFSKPATHEEARLLVRDFICFYNQYRLCQKTGLTPYEKRSQSA